MTELAVVHPINENADASAGTDAPAGEHQVHGAREWLNQFYANGRNGSWAEIGKQVGFSSGALNAFSSGKYTGDNTKVAKAIEAFRETVEARASIVMHPTFVQTSISRLILDAIDRAKLVNYHALIATEAGCGKTETLRHYAAQNPATTLYIACTPAMSSRAGLLYQLQYHLTGDAKSRGSLIEVERTILASLEKSRKVILFDEAQYLSSDALDAARCIADHARMPMVFAGNEKVYELGPRGSSGAASFVQFTSRCVAKVHRRTKQIKREDVSAIAAQMLPSDVADGALDLLLTQAHNSGGLRRVVVLLQLAQHAAAGERLTKAHITRAIKDSEQLGGEL